MIRAALALTAGFVLGTLADTPPVRAVRRWYARFKLGLVLAEIRDVCDDIADAIHDRDMLLAEGLTNSTPTCATSATPCGCGCANSPDSLPRKEPL